MTRNLSWLVKFVAIFGVGVMAAVSAKATSVTTTVTSDSPTTGTPCTGQVGVVGGATLEWSTTGAYLNKTGSVDGCFAGGGSPTAATEMLYVSLANQPGTGGEGSAAELNLLATGWYAFTGQICSGISECTASNSSTNGNNSGMIDMIVNRTSSTQTFTIYNNTGTADAIGNLPSATGCGGSGTTTGTFAVIANTVCFQDLSTGGSISFAVNAPSAVPEPATSALIGLGLAAASLLGRRKIHRA